MPVSFGYVLTTPPLVPGTGTGVASTLLGGRSTAAPFLGHGLLTPFRRDEKSDFASGDGVELVKCCLAQVLGTRASNGQNAGELPWRPEFGSLLYLLRYMPLDETTQHLARVYVVDAAKRWEPRAVTKSVSVSERASQPNGPKDTLVIKVRFDVVTSNVAGNQVVLRDQELLLEMSR